MDNRTLQTLGEHPDLIAPFGNYLVVELLKAQEETLGGVVLPDQVKDRDKQMLARVVSAGPGQRSLLTGEFMPLQAHPGDLVIVLKHAFVEVKLANKVCHIVFEGDVLGKVDEVRLADVLKAQPEPPPNQESYPIDEATETKVIQRESGLFMVER